MACHLVSSSAWHEYVKPKGRRRWEVVRLLIHQRILKPVWMSASATDRHASLDPWTVAVHLVHERPLLAESGPRCATVPDSADKAEARSLFLTARMLGT